MLSVKGSWELDLRENIMFHTKNFAFWVFTVLTLVADIHFVKAEDKLPLKVAIFVKNKTGQKQYNKYADMLRTQLTSTLSGNFAVIDKDDVINVFQKAGRVLTEQNPANTKPIEQKASALRICQMLGANYLLIGEVEEIVVNNIQDTVYGNKINDLLLTIDISVKIADGRQGGSIVAKTIRTKNRLRGDAGTRFTTADIKQNLPVLVKKAAKDIGRHFQDNLKAIANVKVDVERSVNYEIRCNTSSVTVELNGVTIGTAPGKFNMPPGIHSIRLSKDGYRTFERMINIFDGGTLQINLEMTAEGLAKSKAKQEMANKQKVIDMEIENRKKMVDTVAKAITKLSDAEAKKREAEGEASKKMAEAELKHGPRDINVTIEKKE